MSKIEILRVPDERCNGLVEDPVWETGDLVITQGGSFQTYVCHEHQPALLTALLEQAGAVRVEVTQTHTLLGLGKKALMPDSTSTGPAWLLPIREEGGK